MRSVPATFALMLGLAAALLPESIAAAPFKSDHIEVELVAEATALKPGRDNWLGVRFQPEVGWHVYWRNPGDSGKPTSLTWELPEGISAGEINWPYPQRESLGGIVNYGYAQETLLPVELTLPENWSASPSAVPIKVKASWLVCKDLCIPGATELSLALPVDDAPSADSQQHALFADARARLPQPAPADWKAQFTINSKGKDKTFTLGIIGAHITSVGDTAFFPYENTLINHSSAPRKVNDDAHGLRITRTLSDYFIEAPNEVEGVLVIRDGDSAKAWEIHAQPGEVIPVAASAIVEEHQPGAPTNNTDASFGLVLLFAIAGGLILNLMPCVFPVLSIKAISLIEARGATARRQRAHALAYTFGVLATFTGLAGLLIALRSSGDAFGWGFQLQQPIFVAVLIYLFFAMALSLSGVVEFGTGLMGVGQSLASSSGYRGSFFTGVLAVAVASPCTAPFMGTALGYALSQPAYVALSVFAALGLGLALPFLAIGFFPQLGRLLPKPGAWMQTFKQVMAFPLYITAVWLLWVLGGLTDRNGMAIALLGLTAIAFALWLWNRPGWLATTGKLAALIVALALLALPQIREVGSAPSGAAASSEHEPWSEERLAQLRADGKTVFVNFTADWCITCKVNEHNALASNAVKKAFADDGVVWLEGDWTRSDPDITRELTQFGRSGVPLYLVYAKGGEPKVLPQILTPEIVLNALKGS